MNILKYLRTISTSPRPDLLEPDNVLRYDSSDASEPQAIQNACPANWAVFGRKAWLTYRIAYGRSPRWNAIGFFCDDVMRGDLVLQTGLLSETNHERRFMDFPTPVMYGLGLQTITPHQIRRIVYVARIIADGGFRFFSERENPLPNVSIVRHVEHDPKIAPEAYIAFDGVPRHRLWNWDDCGPSQQERIIGMLLNIREEAMKCW